VRDGLKGGGRLRSEHYELVQAGSTDLINSSPKSRGWTSISSTNGPGTKTLSRR
jgi:hypothetical protein